MKIRRRSIQQGVIQTLLSICLCAVFCALAHAQIELDGRYWSYNGERVLLLGGWNHGHNPFIDHDTDNDRDNKGVSSEEQIAAAMDELAEAGGNYLRCVLDPGMAAGVQGFDFCARQGERYDLSSMQGAFWNRIAFFIAEAEARGIVVQIELWDRFDLIDGGWTAWPDNPWNPINNVNYTVDSSGLTESYRSYHDHPFLQSVPGHPVYESADDAQKKRFDDIRTYQEAFVDKLLSITLPHKNVLYCMNNETHEDAAWGQYWMNYIRTAGREADRPVLATDMFDDIFKGKDSRGMKTLLEERGEYDYVDISQANSRHRDEAHWQTVSWLAQTLSKADPPYLLHMTKIYGNDLALDSKPWSGFKPGDSNNAIEEWWRNLLAGVAAVRFHRPTAGIGLYDKAKHCIRATRLIESHVRFWNVKPRLDLLSDREADEAYLGADSGNEYILYLTKDGEGSVKLDLTKRPDTSFSIHWVNVDTGKPGPSATLQGGSHAAIRRPDDDAHWAAAIVRKK